MKRLLHRAAVLAMLLTIAGCAGYTESSSRIAGPVAQPKRLIVVNPYGPGTQFRDAMTDALLRCGIASLIVDPGRAIPGVQMSDPGAVGMNADAILALRPIDAVILWKYGRPFDKTTRYQSSLVELPSHRAVWRGEFGVADDLGHSALGVSPNVDDGVELSRLVVNRLVKDAIITACPDT